MSAAPTAKQIYDAHQTCDIAITAFSSALLGLPLSSVPAELGGGSRCWSWRGGTSTAVAAPEGVSSLTRRFGTTLDLWPDLGKEPFEWVRIVRTGAGKLIVGAETLLGTPALWASSSLSDNIIRDVLRMEHPQEPMIATTKDGPVEIVESHGVLFLHGIS